jgi:hypothetical protein
VTAGQTDPNSLHWCIYTASSLVRSEEPKVDLMQSCSALLLRIKQELHENAGFYLHANWWRPHGRTDVPAEYRLAVDAVIVIDDISAIMDIDPAEWSNPLERISNWLRLVEFCDAHLIIVTPERNHPTEDEPFRAPWAEKAHMTTIVPGCSVEVDDNDCDRVTSWAYFLGMLLTHRRMHTRRPQSTEIPWQVRGANP